ncbi:ABC transporter permease [Aquibacillus koreensis]|uniref:ABC transporter permease n=1 Tax=Aquibacillus koreensis TaxID=279446 RepID=A0A9X3WMT1_9BACI|nr:ABC transporter permease [Aquibacillus koreensis]MCT2537286.1 ABC transporter permease [Aquibacillus koreensis]MDC3421633.1 ABC transporter permease [Aquibacillus koreensis]
MASQSFAKTGLLSRLILRQDRIRIPLWLIGLSFFTLIIPIAFIDLYGTEEQRAGIIETMQNPAMTAMVGPADFANYTLGVMTAHNMILMTAAVVGLMSILLVSRHTRGEEEDGRIEMVRSLPAGRLSNLNATLLIVALTNILLALIVGFGLYLLDIESLDLEGSLLYGAVLGGTGLVFVGVTALMAQLSESARGTTGLSIAILLLAYLLRAITDVSNEKLSWLSPLGWVTKAEVYASNNWWPVVFMVVFSIILLFFAYYLNAIRDLGAGFIPSKPGKRHASRFLQSPAGLALRLQRTGTISWAIGMLLLGSSYGSVLGDLESFFAGNELIEQMLMQQEGLTIVEQFLPQLMIVVALLATIPPIMAINKLYGEEKKGRIDHLLGRTVSRTRLILSYVIIAVVNGFVMLSLATFSLWASGTAVVEGGLSFGKIYGGALAYYPAMVVMIGISALLIGFIPKLTSLVWLYVFYSFIVLYLGGLFQFSDWVGQISPFGFVPRYPVEEIDFLSMLVLSVIALGLIAAGVIGYNRRDIE